MQIRWRLKGFSHQLIHQLRCRWIVLLSWERKRGKAAVILKQLKRCRTAAYLWVLRSSLATVSCNLVSLRCCPVLLMEEKGPLTFTSGLGFPATSRLPILMYLTSLYIYIYTYNSSIPRLYFQLTSMASYVEYFLPCFKMLVIPSFLSLYFSDYLFTSYIPTFLVHIFLIFHLLYTLFLTIFYFLFNFLTICIHIMFFFTLATQLLFLRVFYFFVLSPLFYPCPLYLFSSSHPSCPPSSPSTSNFLIFLTPFFPFIIVISYSQFHSLPLNLSLYRLSSFQTFAFSLYYTFNKQASSPSSF